MTKEDKSRSFDNSGHSLKRSSNINLKVKSLQAKKSFSYDMMDEREIESSDQEKKPKTKSSKMTTKESQKRNTKPSNLIEFSEDDDSEGDDDLGELVEENESDSDSSSSLEYAE